MASLSHEIVLVIPALKIFLFILGLIKIIVGVGLLKRKESARKAFVVLLGFLAIFIFLEVGVFPMFQLTTFLIDRLTLILGAAIALIFIFYYTRPAIRAHFQ